MASFIRYLSNKYVFIIHCRSALTSPDLFKNTLCHSRKIIYTPVHRLDPERCYKPEIFFYQNVGALLFYIVYRYIKSLLSNFNLVYFSASFRKKLELESLPLRFYTIGMQISLLWTREFSEFPTLWTREISPVHSMQFLLFISY